MRKKENDAKRERKMAVKKETMIERKTQGTKEIREE